MKRNNICIFSNTLCSGGAEKQAVLLAKALNNEYQVWLVVYYGEKVEQKFLEIIKMNHIRTIYLSGNHLKRIFNFYQFLKLNKIRIIFSYLFTTNLIGSIVGKFARVSYTIGGIRSSKLDKQKEIAQRITQNYFSSLTVYNNYKGYYLLSNKGFKKEKALVIPNCFEINTKEIVRKKKKTITILSVGRFHEAKDYKTAINIISKLSEIRLTIKYQIIGHGNKEQEIRNWITKFKIEDIVEVIINPANLNDYYMNADIYLMTSIYEGLSNTLLEAMSFSLPIVATNVGDNERLIENNKNGFLCEVASIEMFTSKLEYLVNNYEKRIDFGLNSYKKIKINYSFEKFQQKYCDLIENLEKN